MNKNYMYSFITVIMMFVVAYVGSQGLGLRFLFGVVLPYLSFVIFIIGFSRRIIGWARSAVPFRITTTCGQQNSLPWVKPGVIENPSNIFTVFVRMLLEILCFRSLFRNTRANLEVGSKISYRLEVFLWLGALAFHYAFFVVLVRHLRLFIEPVPLFITLLEKIDSFFRVEIIYDVIQFGLPGVFLSGIVLLLAALYLFSRRILIPRVRYISLASDFFPLFLVIGIAITGILMRYFCKIDVTAAKELTMGLVTLRPFVPSAIEGGLFYSHLFLVSVLLAYFPFSKLMHAGGIFLSPTRNMTGNTRQTRHVSPWNYPVKVHTYEEYENEFREKMIGVGLPVDRISEEKIKE